MAKPTKRGPRMLGNWLGFGLAFMPWSFRPTLRPRGPHWWLHFPGPFCPSSTWCSRLVSSFGVGCRHRCRHAAIARSSWPISWKDRSARAGAPRGTHEAGRRPLGRDRGGRHPRRRARGWRFNRLSVGAALPDPDPDVGSAFGGQTKEPPGGCIGFRRGQRRRQSFRKGLGGEGCLRAPLEGQRGRGGADQASGCGGARRGCSGAAPESHADLCGEEEPCGRASYFSPGESVRGPRLGASPRKVERGPGSLVLSPFDVHRPVCDRGRPDSVGVASHGASGSGVELHGTAKAGSQTFLPFVPQPVVERECGVPSGDGVDFLPNVCNRRGQQGPTKGHSRARGQRRPDTATTTTATSSQGPRRLLRREHSSACFAGKVEPPWPGVSPGCHPNSHNVLGPAGAKPSEAQAEPADRNVAHGGTLGSKPRPDPTAIPESETCFVSWIDSFLGQLWSSRSCLGSFLRDSLRAPACTSVPEHRSGDLWPVPMPSARWTAEPFCNLSPQRRRRGKLFKLVAKLVQLQVGLLWVALHMPRLVLISTAPL